MLSYSLSAVTFTIDRMEYSVSEGDASVAIGIRREGSSAVDTRVMLSTSDITADGRHGNQHVHVPICRLLMS